MLTRKRQKETLLSVIAVILVFVCTPLPLNASMSEMTEDGLSQVSAQSGISIDVPGPQQFAHANTLMISDAALLPDPGWVDHSGADDGDTGSLPQTAALIGFGSHQDLGIRADGAVTGNAGLFKASANQGVSPGSQSMSWPLSSLVPCGQDLGRIVVEQAMIAPGEAALSLLKGNGEGGIDLTRLTSTVIDAVRYEYNNLPVSLTLTGVHLARSAGGAPEDPASWTFSGSFAVEDLRIDEPLARDASPWKNGAVVDASASLAVPVSGTVRVQNVEFGGKQFGPVAIDGITVHRLSVTMPGAGN